MWGVYLFQGERHVVPRFDERTHMFTNCWCNPTPDDERDDVIIHHALDRRERFETEGKGTMLQ